MATPKNILPLLNYTIVKRFWSNVQILPSGCWEWQAGRSTKLKYGSMRFSNANFYTHRIAFAIYYQTEPSALCVRHRCDNPPCCNPLHLIIGTKADNNRDMVERGGYVRGEDRVESKLTTEQAQDIYNARKRGVLGRVLAKQYGVNPSTIYRIGTGKRWSHLS